MGGMSLSNVVLLLYLFASVLILLAVGAMVYSHNHALKEKVAQHFSKTTSLSIGDIQVAPTTEPNWLDRLLQRAGVEPETWQVVTAIALIIGLTLLIGFQRGWLAALFVPVTTAVLIHMWLVHLGQKRIKQILQQLPIFIDLVIRSLSVGRSMESAFENAVKESQEPIKGIFERAVRLSHLGMDFSQTIQQTANIYRIEELNLIALVIHVNRSYGSSVREMLENTVKMINDREATRRELRTLTGETRVTAWVLGLLPTIMATYIMIVNPNYLNVMIEDPSGRWLLIGGLAFQATGGLILWRMIKSI